MPRNERRGRDVIYPFWFFAIYGALYLVFLIAPEFLHPFQERLAESVTLEKSDYYLKYYGNSELAQSKFAKYRSFSAIYTAIFLLFVLALVLDYLKNREFKFSLVLVSIFFFIICVVYNISDGFAAQRFWLGTSAAAFIDMIAVYLFIAIFKYGGLKHD